MDMPVDGRWTCSCCSRFLAATAVAFWDERDPNAYYGLTTRYSADCSKCGHLTDSDALPPLWTATRWEDWADAGE